MERSNTKIIFLFYVFCPFSPSNIKFTFLTLIFAHFHYLVDGSKICKCKDKNNGFYIRMTKKTKNTKYRDYFGILT